MLPPSQTQSALEAWFKHFFYSWICMKSARADFFNTVMCTAPAATTEATNTCCK